MSSRKTAYIWGKKSRNRARLPPPWSNNNHTACSSSQDRKQWHIRRPKWKLNFSSGEVSQKVAKISKIHRDLLGPVKMASVISPSNQISGTGSHKLLSIGESTNRDRVWPGLQPKSDMWTSLAFFYTQGLNTTPEPRPGSSSDLLSRPGGIRGYLAPVCIFVGCRTSGTQEKYFQSNRPITFTR